MSQSFASSSVSAAKVAANRLNASKSTGPRTPRGKAIAARNRLRHGLFARHLLLAGEDADELTALKAALARRLNPRDPMELILVERVVSATWKLQRLERFEALLFQRECDAWDQNLLNDREEQGLGRREPVPADVAWASGSPAFHAQLERLAAQQRQLESTLRRNLRQLSLLQKADIHEPLTEYALETVAGEHSANENGRNEATAAERLSLRSRIAEVQAGRIERAAERRAAAKRHAKKRRNEPTADVACNETDRQNSRNEPTPADCGEPSLLLPVRGERAGERAFERNIHHLQMNSQQPVDVPHDRVPQDLEIQRLSLPCETPAHFAEPSPQPSPRVQAEGGSGPEPLISAGNPPSQNLRNEATASGKVERERIDDRSLPHSKAA